ncbi:MAG: cytochrome D1 domain-containing protein, partial [Candidatus Scalindua sediminis]
MKSFIIAIMLAVAFMAGGAQTVAEEEKAGEHKSTAEELLYWSGKAAEEIKKAVKPEVKTDWALSDKDFEKCRLIYFDRCAGCHGVLRKGATGNALTPDKTREKGAKKLRDFIWTGTGGGMPGWGAAGVITSEDTDLMVKYIQNEPPIPPQWSLADMKKSWKVLIPPEKRPTKPQHKRDVDNMFAVVLRDAGQVAIIDGDTKEVISIVDSGYAVHIVRMSMSG